MHKHFILLVTILVAVGTIAIPSEANCPKTGCPQRSAPVYQAPRQQAPQQQFQQQRQFQQKTFQQPNQNPFQQRNSQTSGYGASNGQRNPFAGNGQRNPFAGQSNTNTGVGKGASGQPNPFSSRNYGSANGQRNSFAGQQNANTGIGKSGPGQQNPFKSGTLNNTGMGKGGPGQQNPFGSRNYGSANGQRNSFAGQQNANTGIGKSGPGQPTQAGRKTFAINPTTSATFHQGHSLTVKHNNTDGSQVVARWRTLPNGKHQLDAYKVSTNATAGTHTRQYLDGRKVTIGKDKDFVTRSAPGHLTMTTHKDGLHEASLPNGKPVFSERFGRGTDKNGYPETTIVRTVYARVHGGRAFILRAPVREVYEVVPYGEENLDAYYPWIESDTFYAPFFIPFGMVIPVAVYCPDCVPRDVDFDGPPESYSDPNAMLADMQIAGGFDDGMNNSPDDVGPSNAQVDPNIAPIDLGNTGADSDTQDLKNDVNQMQHDVDTAASTNADLKTAVSNQSTPSAVKKSHVKVSASVRTQMQAQIKEDVAREKAKRPLSLVDVIASAEATKRHFQVDDMLNATVVDSDDECIVSMGDIIVFNKIPDEGAPTAEMRVVTSKEGSCDAGTIVEISVGDLQQMLNAYSRRLEANMQKAQAVIIQAERKQSPT